MSYPVCGVLFQQPKWTYQALMALENEDKTGKAEAAEGERGVRGKKRRKSRGENRKRRKRGSKTRYLTKDNLAKE